MVCVLGEFKVINSIQLLTSDEGNIWYVGPEDKMLPEAEGPTVTFYKTVMEGSNREYGWCSGFSS